MFRFYVKMYYHTSLILPFGKEKVKMKNKKVALHNLGCKVNAYETEAMQQILEEKGYEIVPFAPGADIYIINTCTVTAVSDKKSRNAIRRVRRLNPNAVVGVCGCYAQANPEVKP